MRKKTNFRSFKTVTIPVSAWVRVLGREVGWDSPSWYLGSR